MALEDQQKKKKKGRLKLVGVISLLLTQQILSSLILLVSQIPVSLLIGIQNKLAFIDLCKYHQAILPQLRLSLKKLCLKAFNEFLGEHLTQR